MWTRTMPHPDTELALNKIESIVSSHCTRETSSDPENWSKDNPMHGHCAVVALLVQNIFGGEILRAPLDGVRGYEQMRSHYWNRLPDGEEVDLTASQFTKEARQAIPPGEVRTRDYLLSNEATKKRYELLREILAKRH